MRFRLSVAALLFTPLSTQAAFNIELIDGGGLSTEQWAQFTLAEATWEGFLTGYSYDYSSYVSDWNLQITATGSTIDGSGGVLGSAGPSTVYNFTSYGGYMYTTTGTMNFDTADLDTMLANETLGMVILHEMAHVIGFGTLWSYNGLYDETNSPGEYLGANALAQYNAEFGYSASFVPVELGGDVGTAHAHWDENDGGVNPATSDFGYALMSGWANPGSYITNTTLGQFEDLGYTVNYAYDPYAVVPEPDSPLVPLLAAIAAVGVARRRRATRRALVSLN